MNTLCFQHGQKFLTLPEPNKEVSQRAEIGYPMLGMFSTSLLAPGGCQTQKILESVEMDGMPAHSHNKL